MGASVLNISVLNTGSSVVQEIWTNVPGINVTDIPTGTPANITNVIGTLEGVTQLRRQLWRTHPRLFHRAGHGQLLFLDCGQRLGAALDFRRQRIRSTKFCARGSRRPTTRLPRGKTEPPRASGICSRRSSPAGWRSLPGRNTYLEILHKAGTGTNDNWSVGWLQDPTGTNTTPAGVVPGYLLSRYYPPLPANIPGTLYSANLLALPGVVSDGVGSATLRVSADGTQATLSFTITNLVGNAHRQVHQFRSVFERSRRTGL